MLFNSLEFLFFFPVVFALYWISGKKSLKIQNLIILAGSYFFYGWWDKRFLLLIILSTVVDFIAGIKVESSTSTVVRKRYLWLSVIFNLGMLGFFKYYNFFVQSFVDAFSMAGVDLQPSTLSIVLPVGISFYTFQTMSYTIDVYNGKLKSTKDFVSFAAFVSFFPQLVAGPIERATNLLPQVLSKRKFDYQQAVEGMRLVLWGFLKKIVIADALAPSVNEIFDHHGQYSSGILIMGAVFFAFQIYGDFSGYSDIARGLSKLMGFELMLNFKFPYFSRNVGDFWRRWHISLSTWFRDYLYIPLGGSKTTQIKSIRNVFIIFLVSGFWHGANWTFIAWGALHAILFIPLFVLKRNKSQMDEFIGTKPKWTPSVKSIFQILFTFSLVTITWVFFRAETIGQACDYIYGIFNSTGNKAFLNPYNNAPVTSLIVYLVLFVVVDFALMVISNNKFKISSWFLLATDVTMLMLIIINIPVTDKSSFIYFQF